jgi:EAL domain-containing protein (putative c-di-GMP-specific phosphodiesterase class I)
MNTPTPPVVAGSQGPYLEHFPEPGGVAHRVPLLQLPFHVGRSTTAHYIIYSSQVSKEHAVISRGGDGYLIRDLGSTNGTFINGRRVTESPLVHGDILHFANKECRFVSEAPAEERNEATETASVEMFRSVFQANRDLGELIDQRQATVVFQPVVLLATRAAIGYEALGRGAHPDLSTQPDDLFRVAHDCGRAAELSRMFRALAAAEAARLPDDFLLFVNLHPAEVSDGSLIPSLAALPERLRRKRLVLEVHEQVVADALAFRKLRAQLNELEVRLAFDDFGSGQSRITELAEAPPDFAKLDRKLVQDVDGAPARQEMIRALVNVLSGLGVAVLAEGIETDAEAQTCRTLGCQYGQGYLFGRPQPLEAFAMQKTATKQIDRTGLRPQLTSRPA